MDRKLLHKTQRIYLIYFTVILLITAPLFYFIIHKMYIDNADESLRLREYEFRKNNISSLHISDIPIWNKYNPYVKIVEDKGLKNDSLFYTYYYENQDEETELYRELNTPITIENTPFTFSARTNLVESEDLIMSIAILFLIIIILLLAGLYFMNKRMSEKLWNPFYQTLQQIEDFEIDKHKIPTFNKSDIEEFNRLNISINNLIEKNTIIYNNQREFVENAAHELQTPIAVFKAKIDTIIQRSDITQGQAGILVSLNKTVSRLSRLNKNLLLLSKIENNQFNKTTTFSINELIEDQLQFFIEQAEQKNIEIKTDFQNDVLIDANRGLTEILVNNLLLNAIKHNIEDGQINISIFEQTLGISNKGIDNELPKNKLFKRFSKSNPSGKGTGLGLAIIKKIADTYGWIVSYYFKDGVHQFSIRF
ncbi:MAG TPA: HAMP domain-containing histidine kinase [Bacteroidetes bacterium]|nr:HAMP domain-containing histidine kinase [Bacteroidota bacterium]